MRSRGERRRPRAGDGGAPPGRLSATAFVGRLKGGLVPDPQRSELAAGAPAWAPVAAGQEAEALVRLARELARAVQRAPVGATATGRAPARPPHTVAVAPLLRIGPADLWRPRLALLRGAGRRPPGWGETLAAADVLLVVESGREAAQLEGRLAGYAAAGVREAWLLELQEGWTVAYRSPWAGAFASRTLWYPGEVVPIGALLGAGVEALERGFTPAPAGGST